MFYVHVLCTCVGEDRRLCVAGARGELARITVYTYFIYLASYDILLKDYNISAYTTCVCVCLRVHARTYAKVYRHQVT